MGKDLGFSLQGPQGVRVEKPLDELIIPKRGVS